MSKKNLKFGIDYFITCFKMREKNIKYNTIDCEKCEAINRPYGCKYEKQEFIQEAKDDR